MQTILVATDYSRAAGNALAYAAAFAQQMQARLVLFNAYQLPAPMAVSLLPEERKNSFVKDNQARLASLALQTSQRYGITVNWTSTQSYLIEALDQQVANTGASLVVMGTRRKVGDDLNFGSTTTQLIRHSRFPILIVPEDYTFTHLQHILFACDYHLLATDNKLSLLQKISLAFKAEVQVLHVEKEKEELVLAAYQSDAYGTVAPDHVLGSINLDTIFANIKHSYKYVEDKDVVQGIARGAEEFGADLLVMVPHKTSFWETLLDKSLTCRMALRTHLPLLAMPNLPGDAHRRSKG